MYLQLFQRAQPIEGMLLDALNLVFIQVAFKRREGKKHEADLSAVMLLKDTPNSYEPQPKAELVDWIQG